MYTVDVIMLPHHPRNFTYAYDISKTIKAVTNKRRLYPVSRGVSPGHEVMNNSYSAQLSRKCILLQNV